MDYTTVDSGLQQKINKLNKILTNYKAIITGKLRTTRRNLYNNMLQQDLSNKKQYAQLREKYFPAKMQFDTEYENFMKRKVAADAKMVQAAQSKKLAPSSSRPPVAPSSSRPPVAPSSSRPPVAPSSSRPPVAPSSSRPPVAARKIDALNDDESNQLIYLFLTNKHKIKLVFRDGKKKYSGSFGVQQFQKKFYKDYDNLEHMHNYIQWIFPSFRQSDFQTMAPPINPSEHQKLLDSYDACYNFIVNYIIILDFYGFSIISEDGDLTLNENYMERFENVIAHNHNNLRISRILNSLNIMGLNHFAKKFIAALKMAIESKSLYSESIRESYNKYWSTEALVDSRKYKSSRHIARVMSVIFS